MNRRTWHKKGSLTITGCGFLPRNQWLSQRYSQLPLFSNQKHGRLIPYRNHQLSRLSLAPAPINSRR